MGFPERFSVLPQYPFARLRKLVGSRRAGGEVIDLSVGAPSHAFPSWLSDTVAGHGGEFGRYPPTFGTEDLLSAVSGWIDRRYAVCVDPGTRILALSGTREGLFNVCLWLVPEAKGGRLPCVLVPNPFYQVYAAGAVAAGAEPVYVPAVRENGYLPDYASLPDDILDRTSLAFICSPSNPQGAVASAEYISGLLALAELYDFRVVADECYSEIYRGAPPPGVLQVTDAAGADPERVVVMQSLSKRSNLPGIRSGFLVAGAQTMERIKVLREYSAASLPGPLQAASARAWREEEHVEDSRRRYCEKFAIADRVLDGLEGYRSPEGGIFLWLNAGDGEAAALKIWTESGVRVLPGAYLGREVDGRNPGAEYIRVALVADEKRLEQGLGRIAAALGSIWR